METASSSLPAQEEDAALFRATIGEVTPIAAQNRIVPNGPSRHAIVRTPSFDPQLQDTLSDHATEDAQQDYLANGLSRMALRKLRKSAVQDLLDLHGCQTDAARMLLQQFIAESVKNGLRCILVIHGKGMNSPGGEAVLRSLTRSWLMQHPQVLAFCPASPRDGGSGAVIILLRTGNGEL